MTIRDAFRKARGSSWPLACEWNPTEGRPAKMGDEFHAFATVQVGIRDRRIRACEDCAATDALSGRGCLVELR